MVGEVDGFGRKAGEDLDDAAGLDEGGTQDGKEQLDWEYLGLDSWTSDVVVVEGEEPGEMNPAVIYGDLMRRERWFAQGKRDSPRT